MAQMFQILSQTNVTMTSMANQGAMGDPPYGMPYGWKAKGPVIEEHEQHNIMNNDGAKVVLNTGLGVGPNHRDGS
ncbi:hypothetical protein CR513_36193, partial [Mucuna pruriens]